MLPPTAPDAPTPQEPLPGHLRFSARNGGLEISHRWSGLTSLLLSTFCCFGCCGLYGQALVEGTVREMKKKQFVGYIKVPWLGYLMMGVSALLSVLVLYTVLLSLVNRITVRAEPGRLRLLHRPLPWPVGTLDLRPENCRFETIEGLKAMQGEKNLLAPSFILIVIDQRGWRHKLVPGLKSQAQGEWLAAELRRVMAGQA